MTNEERIYALIESAYSLAVTATNRITELKQENSELKKRVAKLENASKPKRKFRVMTIDEHCNQTACQKCEYYDNTYGCYYRKFNHVNVTYSQPYYSQPYRKTNGKYILVEVIE